jgi:hypothetical protein
VEHTLPLFESEHPDHERRLLIETARAYARGEIEPEELRAVWLVWDVDARGSAAARHIAHRAAWSGAAAVLNATAAWDAAWDAAWAAASAALDAERAWQAQRLARYLGIDGGRN